MRWHDGLNIEVKSCVFEYSWSDLMGILNIQKVPSGYFEYPWSHGYFQYSWSDVMGILNVQKLMSWTFWIIMKWHWHFEYEVTLWNYSEADAMGILNIIVTLLFLIFIQNYGVFWIFIVMTSLPRIFKIPMSLWIFKIPMTPAFNIPMTALCEYSKYPCFMHNQNTHDVSLNIH